jgi:hypothetical protein
MLRRKPGDIGRQAKRRWSGDRRARSEAQAYATTLMLAAVVGAAANAATVIVEIGRSAGWWH